MHINLQIISSCVNCLEISDRGQAIETAIRDLRDGDLLVIAGKGHENVQLVEGRVIPFNDTEVAEKILKGAIT